MDRTILKVDKLQRLQTIAMMSALSIVEMDHYIRLAMMVEHYVREPSQEAYEQMSAALHVCGSRHQRFHKGQQQLLNLLVENGNLNRAEASPLEPAQAEIKEINVETEVEVEAPRSKVIQFNDYFKKKVDDPK